MRAFGLVLCLAIAGCAGPGLPPAVPLRAGTAKVKITPTEPVMLAGYASRDHPSEGIAADLFARALALDDGRSKTVIVTADIIGFGPVISRAIKAEAREKFGLPEERLLLVGSHTHSGPVISERALVDRPEQVKARDAYVEGLRAKVLEAIGGAIRSLAPGTLRMARGTARLGMYRRVKQPNGTWTFGKEPGMPIDPDLPVMEILGSDGKPRAIFFTYACHCTSVRSKNEGFYLVHPDWAICCAKLEGKMPGTQVMFVTGCGGDIDPDARGPIGDAERNAGIMLGALETVLKDGAFRPISGPIEAGLKRIDLPLEKPDRAAFEKMAASSKPGEQKFASEQLKKMEDGSLPSAISYPVQVLRFGRDLTMACLAGETCVEYAFRLKRELGAENTWVSGYSNEVMCYIPSERVLAENGYESGWQLSLGRGVAAFQMSGSGWPTPFAPGLEDRIVATVHELVNR